MKERVNPMCRSIIKPTGHTAWYASLHSTARTDFSLLTVVSRSVTKRTVNGMYGLKAAFLGDIEQATEIYADMTLMYQNNGLYAYAAMALTVAYIRVSAPRA